MEPVPALREFAKLVFGLVGVIVVAFLLLQSLSDWILLGVVVTTPAAYLLMKRNTNASQEANRINCPACGARMAANNDVCENCGEPP